MEPNPTQAYEDNTKIESIDLLPVKNRKKTDFFCTIFWAVYVLLLALILVFVYNQGTCLPTSDNLNRITYPTDNEGKLCGYDHPDFPYVYYTTTTDPVNVDLSLRQKDSALTNVQRAVKKNWAANQPTL